MTRQSRAAALILRLCIVGVSSLAQAGRGNAYFIHHREPAPWNVYVEGRAEYDSNVLQMQESGQNAQTGQSDISFNGIAYGEHRPPNVPGSRLRALGLYQGYRRLNDFDLMGASIGAQQDVALGPIPTRFHGDVQHFHLARKPYLWMETAGFDSDLFAGRKWKMSAGYQIGFKKFTSAQFTDFDGFSHKAALTLYFPWRLLSAQIKTRGEYLREQVRRDIFRYWGAGGLLELQWTLPLDIQFKLQPEIQSSWYDPHGAETEPYRRNFQQKYGGEFSYLCKNHILGAIGFTRTFNRSTITAFTYQKYTAYSALSLIF